MDYSFSSILVCYDGSKYSDKALRQACDLAKRYGASLTVIHIIEKTKKSDVLAGSEYTKILRRYAKSSMEKAQKIAKDNDVEPTMVTKEGNVAKEIVQFAKSSKTDLVVVGSKGLGAVLQFLLGSVSSNIANHSMCSVLIVK
ncbi:universal stress protein [Candidatus Nitrosotenuis cloacae]|uniref:universal stress protein n=1 Tax=Candidatus Nitrosotenuis cloacae TaxID=1603555 RepID=UPI00227EDDA5|nr:universal stress protein [Candidatus Nitrosotenuis cloacae]